MSLKARIELQRGAFTLDADFQTGSAGVTVLFGPSGCGKTSLLRILAGLDRVPEAEVQFEEEVWQDATDFVPTHERSVGYVFQEPSLFEDRSVLRNLEYGFRRREETARRISWDEAVELCGVDSILERQPATLSGGERQRVALARALLASPRLLLLDEPLASLDTASKSEILPFLERLRDEIQLPMLYVTHNLVEAARLGDQLILLDAGHVCCQGPVNELLTRLDLPFAKRPEALAVLQTQVQRFDAVDGLLWLECEGQPLAIVGSARPPGTELRIQIRAQDVALSLERHADSSVLNVLESTVDKVAELGPAQVVVRLNFGETSLLAHITRRSARHLQLEPGKPVYAQVKCSALSL